MGSWCQAAMLDLFFNVYQDDKNKQSFFISNDNKSTKPKPKPKKKESKGIAFLSLSPSQIQFQIHLNHNFLTQSKLKSESNMQHATCNMQDSHPFMHVLACLFLCKNWIGIGIGLD